MPQVQFVNPEAYETPNRAEENLKTFFSNIGKEYQDKADKAEIGNLLGEYKKNRGDANAWEDLQLGLETSNISPSRRLQTQASLNEMKKHIIEQDKVLNARIKSTQPTKKTQASQPVDEEQRSLMEKVQSDPAFKAASLPEKGRMLVNAGVSKENSKFVLDSYAEEGKKDAARQEVLEKKQAEADIEFYNMQQQKAPMLFNRGRDIQRALEVNREGATGGLWDQAMQQAGMLQFTSEGYREFASLAKEMVKNQNIKSIIGAQISAMEFNFFRDATISERFSEAANDRIIKKEEIAHRYEKLYNDITNEIVEQNGGEPPKNLQALVNKEFAIQSKPLSEELKKAAEEFKSIQTVPYGKTLMFTPDRVPIHVPNNEVKEASKLGATLK